MHKYDSILCYIFYSLHNVITYYPLCNLHNRFQNRTKPWIYTLIYPKIAYFTGISLIGLRILRIKCPETKVYRQFYPIKLLFYCLSPFSALFTMSVNLSNCLYNLIGIFDHFWLTYAYYSVCIFYVKLSTLSP